MGTFLEKKASGSKSTTMWHGLSLIRGDIGVYCYNLQTWVRDGEDVGSIQPGLFPYFSFNM